MATPPQEMEAKQPEQPFPSYRRGPPTLDGSKTVDGDNIPIGPPILRIVENPATCGYLAVFCRQQYNAENLNFWIAVDVFKEKYRDNKVWPKRDLKEIDEELKAIGDAYIEWPSQNVSRDALESGIQEILDRHINDTATQQVMLPSAVKTRTEKRLEHIALYGPQVFDECLLDPLKTLDVDIQPRFLRSPLYQEMLEMCSYIYETEAQPEELDTPVPEDTLLESLSLDELKEKTTYTLDEIINDRYLFSFFCEHLSTSYRSENLLCVRHINLFEQAIAAEDIDKAKRKAWELVRFFVKPGSPYEISCTSLDRKMIQLRLAAPRSGMFNRVKADAVKMIAADFDSFKGSAEYNTLPSVLLERFIEVKTHGKRAMFMCFSPRGNS